MSFRTLWPYHTYSPHCFWEHLPSPQVLLGLAQYRRADDTTVIRNGTCMVCDNTVVDCSLVPHCSHLPPPREIRGMDLAHVNLLNAPSWPSQGLIRDIAAPGNHTQLGGISPRSNIPVRARAGSFAPENGDARGSLLGRSKNSWVFTVIRIGSEKQASRALRNSRPRQCPARPRARPHTIRLRHLRFKHKSKSTE